MRILTFLLTALIAAAVVVAPGPAVGDEPAPSSPATKTPSDPAMAELSRLVGGTWVNSNPKFVVENRYEWAFGGTAIRGNGVVGKGSPHESQIESILGWDPVGKSVFYVDCHGGNTVYKGTVKKEDNGLLFEFATAVGPPSKWREIARFTDDDTMEFTIYGEKEGKWSAVHSEVLKRKSGEAGPDTVVTEGVVDAPVEQVWAALCTREGLESWNVAHADVDLRVGGLMRHALRPQGQDRRSRHDREHDPQLRAQPDALHPRGEPPREVPLQERHQDRLASHPPRAHRPGDDPAADHRPGLWR